jgi:hypothetical protein
MVFKVCKVIDVSGSGIEYSSDPRKDEVAGWGDASHLVASRRRGICSVIFI